MNEYVGVYAWTLEDLFELSNMRVGFLRATPEPIDRENCSTALINWIEDSAGSTARTFHKHFGCIN